MAQARGNRVADTLARAAAAVGELVDTAVLMLVMGSWPQPPPEEARSHFLRAPTHPLILNLVCTRWLQAQPALAKDPAQQAGAEPSILRSLHRQDRQWPMPAHPAMAIRWPLRRLVARPARLAPLLAQACLVPQVVVRTIRCPAAMP